MWSDGETMWITDDGDDKLYAYKLATKERDPDKDFDESGEGNLLWKVLKTETVNGVETTTTNIFGPSFAQNVWSDGETMWVAHFQRRRTNSMGEVTQAKESKIFAYNLTTKARDSSKDFGTLLTAGNENPVGLWSDDTTMWVADSVGKKIYAYKMSDKSRDPSKDFDTLEAAKNTNPKGIWSNDTTMWVADSQDDKIYAYNLSTKARESAKDFDTLIEAGNNAPFGIWSDDATMWVLDSDDDKIYAYRLSDAASLGSLKLTGHIPPGNHEYKDFEVRINPAPFDSGTTRYTASVPYATSHLTVTPETLRTSEGGFSYSPAEDASTTDGHQVNLAVGNNRVAVTVTNRQATGLPRTRTYEVNVKREFFTYNDPSKDVALSTSWMPTNVVVRGLWTDGATMWLSARESTQNQNGEDPDHFGKLYSYDLQSTNLVVSTTNLTHNNPYGIWADNTTMWIADSDDDKLYAYNILDRARFSEIIDGQTVYSKDISLDENNSDPEWIWSDGITMWVTDDGDNTIYAYGMSNKLPDPTKNINLADVDTATANRVGLWSDGATLWIADNADDKLFAYKLKTDESSIKIHCPDATEDFNTLKAVGNHNPEAIFSDGSTMWVVDNTAKKIFAYNQPLSANNKLKRLELSNVYSESTSMLLEEVFSSVTNNYSAYVVYTNLSTTVTAIAQDPDAGVSIQPKDADLATPGHQVNLSVGNNPIAVTVTAENAAVEQYIVNVTRRYNDGRLPFKDFNFLTTGNTNANPTGLWSDGTNMWVLDGTDKKFYVYKMTDDEWGRLDGDKGFELEMDNSAPGDIWSTNGIMWVPNRGGKIYAYYLNASANHYHSSEDFNTLGSTNTSPRGLWSDGTTMWVVDDSVRVGTNHLRKIFAYNLNLGETNKTRVNDKEFTLSVDNVSPWGIWSNGTNMWVLDRDNNKLYAYEMLGENRGDPDPSKNIDLLKDITLNGEGESFRSYLGNPRGIWSNGEIMWVSDLDDKKIYAYDMSADVSGDSDVSNDSTLSLLRLSGISLSPVFSPDEETFAAQPEALPRKVRKFPSKRDTILLPSTSPPKMEYLGRLILLK